MQRIVGTILALQSYRIAIGPRQGHKAFTPQTVPAQQARTGDRLAKAAGFSIHAGVATQPWERHKLERLARYVTRPAISEQRLSLTAQGRVRYELKTPYRDGTTHVFFEPLDFIARLAALDCRDAGGRATQEQLPTSLSRAST